MMLAIMNVTWWVEERLNIITIIVSLFIYKLSSFIGRIQLTILFKVITVTISTTSYFYYNQVIMYFFLIFIACNNINDLVFGFSLLLDHLKPLAFPQLVIDNENGGSLEVILPKV